MCTVDRATVEAAIASLTAAYPRLAEDVLPHPALAGCEDVAWSEIPGCPAEVPVVLRGLLDPDAAEEAQRVLGDVVLSGPLHMSLAMPVVVPFLLRLVADPAVPRRGDLFEKLLVAAMLCEPVDPGNASALAVWGREEDHPERSSCRAAFAAAADGVRRLLADPALSERAEPEDRASLMQAAGV